ncbi:MAG: glycosyltransferase family 2 protein [Pseudomonadota bacterium]
MTLTIATVALNAAKELPATIESVIGQDFPDIEYLILDGGSWDDTHKVLGSYRDAVSRIEIVEDGGIYQAMNMAVAKAKGEYILFLNAGDRLYSHNTLSKMWARHRDGVDAFYGNHIYVSKGVETFRRAGDFGELFAALRLGELGDGWLDRFPAHQATFTRTALLRDRPYDTALRICADHDFLLHCADKGCTIQYVDEIVAHYAGGGMSASREDLCRLEWNAIYRAHCEVPDRVYTFFYGSASPFKGSPSPCSGAVMSGLIAPEADDLEDELSEPFHWMAGEGMRIRTPSHRDSTGIVLKGFNPAGRQALELYIDDEPVARQAVATGDMASEIAFPEPLGPGTIIELIPLHSERQGKGIDVVGPAVTAFSFMFEDHDVPAPLELNVPVTTRDLTGLHSDVLGHGWWPAESTHIWSRDLFSELRLASLASVTSITVTLRRNPFVDEQDVRCVLNGFTVMETAVQPGTGGRVTIPVGNTWKAGGQLNKLNLQPSVAAQPPGDHRNLGVALVELELS